MLLERTTTPYCIGPANVDDSDRVLKNLQSYICASPVNSRSQLSRLHTVLLENDHVAIRRLIVRSAFRCLCYRPQKLAELLCIMLDCEWWQVKDDVVSSILDRNAVECYSRILSTDVVIEKLWPWSTAGLNPFVKVEGVNTDAVFTTILPDFILWQVVSPDHLQHRHRRGIRMHRQRPRQDAKFPPAFDKSIDCDKKQKALVALETMKSCHAHQGLYQSLARIYRRPMLACDDWQMLLLTVLVQMGHTPSPRLLKTLEEADDYAVFVSWYKLMKQKPMSLRECARMSIRKSMKKDNIKFAISKLQIPQILKDFILFSEVNDVMETSKQDKALDQDSSLS